MNGHLSYLLSFLALLACGCGGATTSVSTAEVETAEPASGQAATTESSASDAPVWPSHGARYFAVYVAVADEPSDPALTQASERLRAEDIAFSVGELGCDTGALEALGLEAGYAVSVYFENEDQAVRFVATHEHVGVATVTVHCAD